MIYIYIYFCQRLRGICLCILWTYFYSHFIFTQNPFLCFIFIPFSLPVFYTSLHRATAGEAPATQQRDRAVVFSRRWFLLYIYIYIYLRKNAGIHLAVGHEGELMAGGSGEALGVLMCTPQWGLCRGWGSSDPLALQSQWMSSSHTSLLFRKEKALFLNSNYFCDLGELAKVKKILLCFQAVQNHK